MVVRCGRSGTLRYFFQVLEYSCLLGPERVVGDGVVGGGGIGRVGVVGDGGLDVGRKVGELGSGTDVGSAAVAAATAVGGGASSSESALEVPVKEGAREGGEGAGGLAALLLLRRLLLLCILRAISSGITVTQISSPSNPGIRVAGMWTSSVTAAGGRPSSLPALEVPVKLGGGGGLAALLLLLLRRLICLRLATSGGITDTHTSSPSCPLILVAGIGADAAVEVSVNSTPPSPLPSPPSSPSTSAAPSPT